MKARDITAFLHGKSATIVAAVFAFVSCVVAWQRGAVIPIEGDLGVGFPSANMWIASARTSAIVNMSLTAVVALAMLYINRVFNVLRSLTSLVATMFLVPGGCSVGAGAVLRRHDSRAARNDMLRAAVQRVRGAPGPAPRVSGILPLCRSGLHPGGLPFSSPRSCWE